MPPAPPCVKLVPSARAMPIPSTRSEPRSVRVAPAGEGEAGRDGTSENQLPWGPPQKLDWRSDEDTLQSRETKMGLWSDRMEPLDWRKFFES